VTPNLDLYTCHISNNRDRCHMYNILVLLKRNDNLWHSEINVREYRRDNQNWIIERNWQPKVYKTKKNNMCWTKLCANSSHIWTKFICQYNLSSFADCEIFTIGIYLNYDWYSTRWRKGIYLFIESFFDLSCNYLSEWLLIGAKGAIFQLGHGEIKLNSMRW
jgi:hypothetical protein